MAITIEVPYSKTIPSARDVNATFTYLADVKSSIPSNFPHLDTFESSDGSTYHWRFRKFEHSGYSVQVEFFTSFNKIENKEILITAVPKPNMGNLSGKWQIENSGQGSLIHFNAKLELELPIPSFLKMVAAPLAQKELTKLFDIYAQHVGKALS